MMLIQQKQATNQPSGDIVAATVAELRSSLRDLLANGVRHLEIDLTHVTMVDSAGKDVLNLPRAMAEYRRPRYPLLVDV